MSETFIGIENSNEFFTQHYLAAILTGELKPLVGKWREQATADKDAAIESGDESKVVRTPPQALAYEHLAFFRHRERMQRLKTDSSRVEAHKEMAYSVLHALGYAPQLATAAVTAGHIPLLAKVNKADGAPLLWCIPAVGSYEEERPTLARPVLEEQFKIVESDLTTQEWVLPGGDVSLEELVTEAFNLDEPPRFIVIVGETQLYLLERSKWSEQRLLSFDLEEILGRRDGPTLDVTAAILHRECLVPSDGAALVDTFNDSSHKHAFGVSEDLKYALQGCIERLGNAAIEYKQKTSKRKVYGTDVAEQVSRECLRYMYRMLFLFYIEARPELGYAPMGSDAYRLGYSLERLRELEQLDLQTEEARQGTYIHQSLQLLFDMLYDGRRPEGQEVRFGERRTTDKLNLSVDDASTATSLFRTFELQPLRTHLFDPARTPFLNGVKFSNVVLRQVIEDMSLTRPSDKKSKRRGRISYATLGINQLGAVYEALLSFRGFFAETDLYEVKPAKEDDHDVLKTAYFVPEGELPTYVEKERVYEEDGKVLKRYPKGTFIYRLAGRDRQTSASYYTPEVLTRCLVKYALKELLEDDEGRPTKTADEILELTVCEPAMGSAAFLNEAVDQLAEAYLRAKQKELGERISHDRYGFEKQRVKMFLADNNVFGVDLNPIAVELAEVSLWLNTIHEGGFVPWFGGQTVCGNSLIGARRQIFRKGILGEKSETPRWTGEVPEHVPLGKERPKGSVYHFLLGDLGMSVYGQGNEGKPIRAMASDALDTIDDWRSSFCAPLGKDDAQALSELSDAVDRLWMRHVDLLRRIRGRTTDPMEVYGKPLESGTRGPTTTAEKDAIWRGEMESKDVRAASPYRRLKLVMDYWCALWFWPIEKAELLPDRDEFLADLALLLDTDVLTTLQGGPQKDLFSPTMPADEARALAQELGVVDIDRLVARNERLQTVEGLSKRIRFLHWELEFADLFEDRGGFDLMVGNPPWILVEWSEHDFLGDSHPVFVLKELDAIETDDHRKKVLLDSESESRYLQAHEEAAALRSYLCGRRNFPGLEGVLANLYKRFLPVCWRLLSDQGVVGLLHPEGVFDDPRGGAFRSQLYLRLRRHYQFQNGKTLFPIAHRSRFSVNIYGPEREVPRFFHVANLFWPSTIEQSHQHSGDGPCGGVKDASGDWNVEGHANRVIDVDDRMLAVFASVFDPEGTPHRQAKLPVIHTTDLVRVLGKFSAWPTRIENLIGGYKSSPMWHESGARRQGTIRRHTSFPDSNQQLILSGPHIYVGHPFYKTPRAKCVQKGDYDVVDLSEISDDYLPRTNFEAACAKDVYLQRTAKVDWNERLPVTDFYRVAAPRGLSQSGERTLRPAIVPPGVAHIHGVYSYTLEHVADVVACAGSWASLPVDLFVKISGVGDFFPSLARQLPIISRSELAVRTLLLNCVTVFYSDIWLECFRDQFREDAWSKGDPRLSPDLFRQLESGWSHSVPLRSDFARRQALVEIDVITAMELGLSLEDLCAAYRVQFPVLQENEQSTWYDMRGRIVHTRKKGLSNAGLPRTTPKGNKGIVWDDVKDLKSGTVERTIVDDTLPGGPRERTIVYEAPFDRCDREHDYRVAWKHFSERLGEKI